MVVLVHFPLHKCLLYLLYMSTYKNVFALIAEQYFTSILFMVADIFWHGS